LQLRRLRKIYNFCKKKEAAFWDSLSADLKTRTKQQIKNEQLAKDETVFSVEKQSQNKFLIAL
jgi:hypothetical protein